MTEAQEARSKNRFVVLEMGDEVKVATTHESEGDAEKTAKELAEGRDVAYAVYQLFGTAVEKPVVVWTGAKP